VAKVSASFSIAVIHSCLLMISRAGCCHYLTLCAKAINAEFDHIAGF
jgi:hypothetical protein